MGVKDFIRLVQKSCPELIRELPNRLADLQGKTIVIDGTLLTQRMHFARMPFRNRHVLGWYRLILDMKEAGVNAITVFDSTKGRPVAKQKEVERRRMRRRLDEARHIMELERLDRLKRLRPLFAQLEDLPSSETQKPTDRADASTFSMQEAQNMGRPTESVETHPAPVKTVSPTVPTRDSKPGSNGSAVPAVKSTERGSSSEPLEVPERQDGRQLSPPRSADSYTGSSDQIPQPFGLPTESQTSDFTTSSQIDADSDSPEASSTSTIQVSISRSEVTHGRSASDQPRPNPSPRTNELQDLFCNFTATKNQFAVIKTPLPSTSAVDPEEELEQGRTYSMSRNQSALAEVEEQIWNRILYASETLSDPSEDVVPDINDQLAELESKSNTIAIMYEGRRPPDQEIYNDCKLILRAMGVPCLESPEAIEGEAYAAALVRNGRADYVASEDTDVIIYEAPLLRGLGSKRNPLLEVDGAQVRTALQLQRESFVDLALLCGTDFSQRLKNIGPFTALKLIRKFNSIENLLVDPRLSAKLPDPDYLDDIAQARLIFAASPPMPTDEALEQGELDSSEVHSLLEKYGLAELARRDPGQDGTYNLGAAFDDVSSPAFTDIGFGESLEGLGNFKDALPDTQH